MILAIDLGGSKCQYGVFSLHGQLLSTTTAPTQSDFLKQLNDIISAENKAYPDIKIISLGVPGPTKNNIMQGSRPLNCLENIDFTSALQQCQLPIFVENDLDMAAYCELKTGAGKMYQQFCLVSISTGIGVSVTNNGTLLKGRIEMGHQVFHPDFEPLQTCTNHNNCWAALCSGGGLVKRFATEKYSTTEAIFEYVLTANDLLELQTMNAQAFGSFINAYDPQAIVVMGSVGLNQFDRIIPPAELIEKFTINRPIPPVIKSSAGSDVGMLGAFYAGQQALSEVSNNA